MNLPSVTSIDPFERFNLTLCTATFDGEISPEVQTALNGQVDNFNQRSPGGPLKPRYHLAFQGNQIFFCQRSSTEAPTKQNFDRLLQELGIALPDEATGSAPTTAPQTAKPAQAAVGIGTK